MSVISSPNVRDYLACRECYVVAFHKYKLFGKNLREKLGATSDAAMEEAFMDPQIRMRFRAEIQHYSELGIEFDTASTNHDPPLNCNGAAWSNSRLNSTPPSPL